MSSQHVFVYPKVTEIGRMQRAVIANTPPTATRRRLDRLTQRELVTASLLRCPDQVFSATARKRPSSSSGSPSDR